jgi:hypothetical protein
VTRREINQRDSTSPLDNGLYRGDRRQAESGYPAAAFEVFSQQPLPQFKAAGNFAAISAGFAGRKTRAPLRIKLELCRLKKPTVRWGALMDGI